MNRFNSFALSMALVGFVGVVGVPAGAQAPETSAPKLVVFITVDAMRPDYVTRFESQLTGGLGRLYRGGAFFSNAFQDHAITETAPIVCAFDMPRNDRGLMRISSTRNRATPVKSK